MIPRERSSTCLQSFSLKGLGSNSWSCSKNFGIVVTAAQIVELERLLRRHDNERLAQAAAGLVVGAEDVHVSRNVFRAVLTQAPRNPPKRWASRLPRCGSRPCWASVRLQLVSSSIFFLAVLLGRVSSDW